MITRDMDYIPDPTLYEAVMHARRLMRQGKVSAAANAIAARAYGLSASDVARYTGQVASRTRVRREHAKSASPIGDLF